MQDEAIKTEEKEVKVPALPKKTFSWQKIVLFVVVLLLLFLIGIGVALYKYKAENNQLVKNVALVLPFPMTTIETKMVTFADFWRELTLVVRACSKTGYDCSITNKDRTDVLTGLSDQKIVEVLAKRENVTVSKADLDKEFDKFAEQNQGKEQMIKIMKDELGWTESDFRTRLESILLYQALEKKAVESVKLKQLLIAVNQNVKDEDAKKKIEDIRKQIVAGKTFADAVKESSDDLTTKDNGGELGYVSRGKMKPEIDALVFALPVGQVSDVVKTDEGYNLYIIDEKTSGAKDSFKNWFDAQKGKLRIYKFYDPTLPQLNEKK